RIRGCGRRARARVGLRRRRGLGAVLDARHRARGAGVRRHRADAPARGRLHAHRGDDLAPPGLRGLGRVDLGIRLPRARPGSRRGRDAYAPRMATVGDVMTRYVLTVEPADSLGQAAEKMVDRGVGAVVVTDFGKIIGILTE